MIIETDNVRIRMGNQLSPEMASVMKVLDETHLDDVMNLQSLILQRLSREDLLLPFSPEFQRAHFSRKGFVIGVLVEDELVAFRNVYFPDAAEAEWNHGRDFNFSEEKCRQTANLQMVCVHPLYRGNRLARKMNRQAIRIVREKNRFVHLMATVSPYNYWNVDILLDSGFVIAGLKKKYNNRLRYIAYQNLTIPPAPPPPTDQVACLTDFQKQEELFWEGYHGFRISEIPGAHIPIEEICDPYHIRKIPDRYEIHFSRLPVEGLLDHE